MPNILGNNIKKFRKIKGINQKEFATKIGVSNVVLSRYENGIRTPDNATQNKIADILDISLDELHGREKKEYTSLLEDTEILMIKDKEGWYKLSEERKKEIMRELSNLTDFYIEKDKKARGHK
ncbi:helix-turn-helix transcriptional regulator [Mammaliicoccus lentus]|uniref:Helix-turn-helix transcriptional regulator n=1 Tax=Mammaliicoccus lentus TaxID=42858 RepID=A0AAX3W8B9_MAMLE|nr:helix-turn-helix transcriptional regulator [Mammaliicoccus lentus]MBW0770666.1 helix-turn-helix domain-containing protein [Mammaliicoccus lentus]WHI61260.1 helix-turn-helix transcriptional regulator [Mammaliicoccus lentus]